LADLELGDWELLVALKKEFGKGDNESAKVAELKQLEQGLCIMDKFMKIFKRAARRSGYERRMLKNSKGE